MTIKALFALAAQYDLEIDQMDVITAFLNRDINREVYVRHPTGFKDGMPPNTCCKLRKSLYGLKQSPRLQQEKLRTELEPIGYSPLQADHCLYRNPKNEIIIYTYVDDFLIFRKDKAEVDALKKQLSQTFKMEDSGECEYFTGVRISRDRRNRRIHLCQDAYIDGVLETFQMSDCDVKLNPLDAGTLNNLVKYNREATREYITRYQSAIRCMMYAIVQTRPDLAYTVSVLSRFSTNPSDSYQKVVQHTLRYLKGTRKLGIEYLANKSGRLEIHGFSDSDHGGCKDTRRSTTGYVFIMANGPVLQRSKRQQPVALSSMEVEYYALTEAAREAVWLRDLMKEVSYKKSDLLPT